MSRTRPLTIIKAMDDPALFGPWFKHKSWDNWRVFLAALFCQPMSAHAMKVFGEFTGQELNSSRVSEGWLIVGRRGGKSLIAALVAVFLACFRDYTQHLAPGERGTLMVILMRRFMSQPDSRKSTAR